MMLCLAGLYTSCTPPDDDGPRGGGNGSTQLMCRGIFDCAADCDDSSCDDACYARGTALSKQLVDVVANCYAANSCADSACLTGNCEAQWAACNANTRLDCNAVIECLGGCSDSPCQSACEAASTSAVVNASIALTNCYVANNCTNAACLETYCAAELTVCLDEGTGGSGGGGGGGTGGGSGGGNGGGSGGGNTTGSGSFNGSPGGQSLAVSDSIFFVARADNQDQGIVVLLADGAGAGICSLQQSNLSPPSSTGLVLMLTNLQGQDQVPLTTGTYDAYTLAPSGSGLWVRGILSTTNAVCEAATTAQFENGSTVTVTTLTQTQIAGTFTGTIDGTSVSGSFNAPLCELSEAEQSSDPVCQ